jgi:hypothetical protein
MDRQTIDQTASEVHLHRALYIIKFLRAMVLYAMLALCAILLYFFAGIDGVFPIAVEMIQAIRAEFLRDQVRDGSGPLGYVIGFSILIIAVIALFIWMYRSITKLRRWPLRVQGAAYVLVGILSLHTTWPKLQFAFESLNFSFAVLAAVGSAITFVIFPASVAVTLWGVSRSPERSSLVATLDPRLAPNLWVYLNKLLDLPRTPLRRMSTAAAYLLALAGTLLLIGSMMHLLTIGGATNKLSVLASACSGSDDVDLMRNCVALSSHWAWQVPFSALLALAGIKLAALLQSTAKRLGGLSVSDVLKRADDRFLLYLRPFDIDDLVLPKPRLPLLSSLLTFRPFPARIEEELFDVADGYRPLIAIGKPGSGAMHGGLAYRTYLDDSQWQGYVADKIRRADRIVMLIKETDGVRWELERVIAEGAVFKTLFLLEPAVRNPGEWKSLETMVAPLLQSAGVPATGFESQPIGFFFRNGQFVEIVNRNRTATSYRTAFSHFLTEPVG